jgi:hypothetical protein
MTPETTNGEALPERNPIMSRTLSSYLRAGLLAALCAASLSARAADLLYGQCTLNPSEKTGQVQLMLVRSGRPGNTFTSGSDWKAADLKGLDLQTAGKHDVRFTIERDAGRFEADGFVNGAEGAGLFRFTPAPGYAAAMAAAGFPGVEQEKQLGFALNDVSVAFAKEMKAQGLEDLDLRNLRAFRIHGVDAAYIKALRAGGVPATNAKSLIAFRIHGVTPDFAKAMRALGYTPTDKQLIALRIHDVTPEYIAGLKAHGMEKLTLDKVISLKIHGIS